VFDWKNILLFFSKRGKAFTVLVTKAYRESRGIAPPILILS